MNSKAEGLRTALLARCNFGTDRGRYDIAVSGGPDSFALLILATGLFSDVWVWHVDHGLRPESGAETAAVRKAALRFGATFNGLKAQLEHGSNLEERARLERRRLLPSNVATGHTADDQAETVLLNMMRGAGIDGLRGIREGNNHPLLALRKNETVSLCKAWDLCAVHDKSNDEPVFRRNRVRHEVLPLLEQIWDRDPVPVLCRQAHLLAADADLLEEMSQNIDPTVVKSLREAPLPLARRSLRRWLADQNGHSPSLAGIERILDVVWGRAIGTQIAGGRELRRKAGRLLLCDPAVEKEAIDFENSRMDRHDQRAQ